MMGKNVTSGVIPGVEFEVRSPNLQAALNALTTAFWGREREEGFCVKCGSEVKPEDFRDELSRREYTITALCQECQDKIFDAEKDDEEWDLD